MARVYVKGYTKKDGTKVPGHYRDVSQRLSVSYLGSLKDKWEADVILKSGTKSRIASSSFPMEKHIIKKVKSVSLNFPRKKITG
jgi:hypothetical protein